MLATSAINVPHIICLITCYFACVEYVIFTFFFFNVIDLIIYFQATIFF